MQVSDSISEKKLNHQAIDHSHLHMPEDHMEQLYESSNPLIRYVHRNRLDSIIKEVPLSGGFKIVDAGCGEGQLLERFNLQRKYNEYHGIDVTQVALDKAAQRCPWAKFKKAGLADTGYEDEFFDVVTCTEVIEHVIEYEVVLKELKRILKRGGILIITFPNEFLWTVSRFILRRDPVKVPDHVNAFTPTAVKKLVNLELVKQKQLPFNTPFFMALGSLIKFRK